MRTYRRRPLRSRTSVGSITATSSARDTASGQRRRRDPIGDVIADAQLAATTPADFGGAMIAFMNPGGVRASLLFDPIAAARLPGEVTYGEAFTVQPFGNTSSSRPDRRADPRVLEQQFAPRGPERVMRSLAGCTYTCSDAARRRKRHRRSIKINGVASTRRPYRVAMNNFLASGGDGFTVFNGVHRRARRRGGHRRARALLRWRTRRSRPRPLNRVTRLD